MAGNGAVPHLTDDQCLDLLHGLLAEPVKAGLLAHLSACPGCERRFQAQFSALERLRAGSRISHAADGRLSVDRVTPAGRIAAWFAPLRCLPAPLRHLLIPDMGGRGWAAGAVAAAVVIFLAVTVIRGPISRRSGKAGPEWLPTPDAGLVLRGDEDGAPPPDLVRGLEAYAAHDLDRAILLLGSARSPGTLDLARRAYLGNALTHRGEYEAAIDVLAPLRDEPLPDPWGSESRWSLFIALRGAGRNGPAAELLEALARQPGEVGERARRVLGGRTAPGGRSPR